MRTGNDEKPFVLDVRRLKYSLHGFREDEEGDEEKKETVNETGDNLSTHVPIGKGFGGFPSEKGVVINSD